MDIEEEGESGGEDSKTLCSSVVATRASSLRVDDVDGSAVRAESDAPRSRQIHGREWRKHVVYPHRRVLMGCEGVFEYFSVERRSRQEVLEALNDEVFPAHRYLPDPAHIKDWFFGRGGGKPWSRMGYPFFDDRVPVEHMLTAPFAACSAARSDEARGRGGMPGPKAMCITPVASADRDGQVVSDELLRRLQPFLRDFVASRRTDPGRRRAGRRFASRHRFIVPRADATQRVDGDARTTQSPEQPAPGLSDSSGHRRPPLAPGDCKDARTTQSREQPAPGFSDSSGHRPRPLAPGECTDWFLQALLNHALREPVVDLRLEEHYRARYKAWLRSWMRRHRSSRGR